MAARAAEARRRVYRAELDRPWWIILACGLIAVGIYLDEVFGLPVTAIDGALFFNPRFGGLVLATVAACVALTRSIRGKWPAAIALAGIAPVWIELARTPGALSDVHGAGDAVMLGVLILLPVTALVTLALPRPVPPPDEAGGGLPPAHLRPPG